MKIRISQPTGLHAWLFLLALLLSLPGSLQAQFTYATNSGTITITGYTGAGGEAVIPATITGLPVTDIGAYAFLFTPITSVSLPSTVTTIGYGAFAACPSLTNVVIPTGVATIGEQAFQECISLASVTLPATVTNIGVGAFSSCSGLNAITVDVLNPAYMSTNGILYDKNGTRLVQCPAGKAGTHTVESGVVVIGACAFQYCVSLTNVIIPNTVINIETGAFSRSGLSRVTIPNGVTNIGTGAFNWCTNLTEVVVPATVTRIENFAFECCYGLTNVYFRGDAPAVGSEVFGFDDSSSVYYWPGTKGWGDIFGGRPVVLWNPQIQTKEARFGIGPKGFGFTIGGTVNIPVIVETCLALNDGTWTPLLATNLTGGLVYFNDPQWTNYPSRLYRIHSP